MPNIPVTWRNQLTVNTTTAGDQFDPDMTQLSNGNILVSWTSDNNTGAGSPPGLDVIGQLFDPLGNKLGGEFLLNDSFLADNEQDMELAALPGGGFVVVYEDTDANGTSIRLNEFNANGVHVTDNSTVVGDGALTDPNYRNPRVAASSATSVLIVYEEVSGDAAGIYGKIYNPTTDTYGAQVAMITGGASGGTGDADVAVLTNGNYVITGNRGDADSAPVYRILTSTGDVVSGSRFVSNTNSNAQSDGEAAVIALTGGGFVIAWTNTDSSDTDVRFSIYNAAGTQTGSGFVNDTGTTDTNNEPVVVALAEGSFVVVVDNDSANNLNAAHFSAVGASLGNFTFAGPATTISAIGLHDGRFAAVWSDTVGEISMEILDTRDTTSDADGWRIGTVDNNIIAGVGVTSLAGGAGLDVMTTGDMSGGSTWSYLADGSWRVSVPAGATDIVWQNEMLRFGDRDVRLWRLEGEDLAGDFNGDGRDDTLLRNESGALRSWETAASGAVATVRDQGTVPYEFQVAGVGKFNAGGTDDILFRQDNGNIVFWSMVGGVQAPGGGIALPLEWHVHAVADFNGDNTDDILLRNANSDALVVWQMSGFGVGAGGGAVAQVTGTWRLLGTGDFNGDNEDDLLWYNSANNALSTWQMNGAAQIGGGVLGALDATWSVQGIADFNADGRDDILWRHQSGALAQWQMNGSTVILSDLFAFGLTAHQQIQNVGTYDAGNTADILWRDTSTGTAALWTLNSTTVSSIQIISPGSQFEPYADWWVL